MGEDEKPDIDSIVDLAMQEYEEEMRIKKKNVVRTPALDSQFVNFCQDVYVHYNDKQVALGEAPITEESNVKEFIDDLVVAYNEFFTLIERSPKIKALHQQKDPKQFVFGFLSHLLDRSFGFKYEFVTTKIGYKIKDTPSKEIPPQINLFKIIRSLLKNYTNKYISDERQKNTKPLGYGELENVTYVTEQGEEIPTKLNAEFNINFWKNIFHDIGTCRFNFGDHNVGSFLDSADPSIHYLCVKASRHTKEDAEIPSPLAMAILHESKNSRFEKFLVVEGVFGNNIRNLKNAEGKLDPELGYEYLYNCLIKYAHETKRQLAFNLCFNQKHPSQGTFEFINYVAKRIGEDPYYTPVNSEERIFKFNTDQYPRLEGWDKVRKYLKLESAHHPTNEEEEKRQGLLNKVTGLLRYANLYFVENRLNAKKAQIREEKEYKERVEEKLGKNVGGKKWKKVKKGEKEDLEKLLERELEDSEWESIRPKVINDDHFYCAWSEPKGYARVVTLSKSKVKKEYKRIFGDDQTKIKKPWYRSLPGMISIGIGAVALISGLFYSNGAFEEKRNFHDIPQTDESTLVSITVPEETTEPFMIKRDLVVISNKTKGDVKTSESENFELTPAEVAVNDMCELSKVASMLENVEDHLNLSIDGNIVTAGDTEFELSEIKYISPLTDIKGTSRVTKGCRLTFKDGSDIEIDSTHDVTEDNLIKLLFVDYIKQQLDITTPTQNNDNTDKSCDPKLSQKEKAARNLISDKLQCEKLAVSQGYIYCMRDPLMYHLENLVRIDLANSYTEDKFTHPGFDGAYLNFAWIDPKSDTSADEYHFFQSKKEEEGKLRQLCAIKSNASEDLKSVFPLDMLCAESSKTESNTETAEVKDEDNIFQGFDEEKKKRSLIYRLMSQIKECQIQEGDEWTEAEIKGVRGIHEGRLFYTLVCEKNRSTTAEEKEKNPKTHTTGIVPFVINTRFIRSVDLVYEGKLAQLNIKMEFPEEDMEENIKTYSYHMPVPAAQEFQNFLSSFIIEKPLKDQVEKKAFPGLRRLEREETDIVQISYENFEPEQIIKEICGETSITNGKFVCETESFLDGLDIEALHSIEILPDELENLDSEDQKPKYLIRYIYMNGESRIEYLGQSQQDNPSSLEASLNRLISLHQGVKKFKEDISDKEDFLAAFLYSSDERSKIESTETTFMPYFHNGIPSVEIIAARNGCKALNVNSKGECNKPYAQEVAFFIDPRFITEIEITPDPENEGYSSILEIRQELPEDHRAREIIHHSRYSSLKAQFSKEDAERFKKLLEPFMEKQEKERNGEEDIETPWGKYQCQELKIDVESELCKKLSNEDKLERMRIVDRDYWLSQYFEVFCENPNLEGLRFMFKYKAEAGREKIAKKLLSLECGTEGILTMLSYPCEIDYLDYLKSTVHCRSYEDGVFLPNNFLKNAYGLTTDFMTKALLLATIGMKEEFSIENAKKMYDTAFGFKMSEKEVEFLKSIYTIDKIQEKLREKCEDKESNIGNSVTTNNTCSQEREFIKSQVYRINIVKLLAMDPVGRIFLERKYEDSKDPVEIYTIGHHLYTVNDYNPRKAERKKNPFGFALEPVFGTPSIGSINEVGSKRLFLQKYLSKLAEQEGKEEVVITFGEENCDFMDPLNVCKVLHCVGNRYTKNVECWSEIKR
ncbi:hypothetical protein HOL83_04490 [Candidatus Woesearchaeota archaeon]|nr:hypothetical protein [Candidatus Woesearchaeota archaeon]MBT6337121.1 hypothetical protein [Candidatus Woesearchaeota archaeon]